MYIMKRNVKSFRFDRRVITFICIVLLGGIWYFLLKLDTSIDMMVNASIPSGFYESNIELELNSPNGGVIYYTLDSSDPNEDSLVYTKPILVDDASSHPNMYSVRDDVAPQLSPMLKEYVMLNKEEYSLPEELVDKCTVIKAISIDKYGNKSAVSTFVYFIGFNDKNEYNNINVVSLVTDPKNLFDYDEGIYVLGKTFFDNFENGTDKTIDCAYSMANYRNRGKAYKKAGNIKIWDANKTISIDEACSLSLQGHTSRGYLPRSFSIIFNDNEIVLYSGSGDRTTKLKNYIANWAGKDLKIETRIGTPCVLFIDGEYWGNYWILEKYDQQYFENKYGVNKTELIKIDNNADEYGGTQGKAQYDEMVEYIASHNMRDMTCYEYVCDNLIDIDSYIDYYALETYIYNYDWPHNNTSYWRSKYIDYTNNYKDGKWRPVLFDLDCSMFSYNGYSDPVYLAAVEDKVFCSLCENEKFFQAYKDRLVYLARNIFTKENIDEIIDNWEEAMSVLMEKEYRRYYGASDYNDRFIGACEDIRLFFERRSYYIILNYD